MAVMKISSVLLGIFGLAVTTEPSKIFETIFAQKSYTHNTTHLNLHSKKYNVINT